MVPIPSPEASFLGFLGASCKGGAKIGEFLEAEKAG
jgi:hypothetical protein